MSLDLQLYSKYIQLQAKDNVSENFTFQTTKIALRISNVENSRLIGIKENNVI